VTRFRFVVILSVLLTGAAASWGGDSPKAVKEIVIKSSWAGEGKPQQTEFLIRNKKGGYYLGKKSVPANLVEALVSALNEADIPQPDLANLGITAQWLRDNAVSAALKNDPDFADAAENQKELFITSYDNPTLLNKILPGMFQFVRNDDYPGAGIVVTFQDGSAIKAESDSSYEFLLPWRLSRNDETTYNADISRALAALMPKKATNRERLAGHGFDAALAEAVMRDIETDWKLLDVDNKIGSEMTEIRKKYSVERAELDSYHHPEYGTATYKGEPEEINLHATIRKSSFPPNVSDALVLRYANGKAEGVQEFLEKAGKYEDLALSLPWISEFIQEHPNVLVRISYVHGLSFSDKAMRIFRNDMHAIGKDALVKEVETQKSEIALLITGREHAETYWLVFPDKHVILWRYGGATGLLNWKDGGFSTQHCSEYQGSFGGCVGAVVSASGELEQTKR
jgi:hypothetical protein